MRTETQKHFDSIVDCMTGTDGGVDFVKFKWAIEHYDKGAVLGDPGSIGLIDILVKFSNLIRVLTGKEV